MTPGRVPAAAAVDLLRTMVATPSPSGGEGELAQHLVRVMRRWGFRAHLDGAGNAIGEIDLGPGPSVMLVGHMDTVPGPAGARLAGDLLYGRGAVDAKGPLAAMICAAAARTFRGRVTVVGAVEEETIGSRGATEIGRSRRPPDALIVGEPSGADAVVLGYKGRLDLRIRIRCPATHPASPAPKATELAVEAWQALLDTLGPTSHRSFDLPGATLAGLHGDPAEASALFTVRTPPGFDVTATVARLRQRLGDAVVEVVNAVPACRAPRTDPVVRALLGAIRRHGGQPRCKVKTATSDMNTLAEFWTVPMATYGPGDSRLDHADDEHLPVAEYLRAIDVLSTALADLSAPDAASGTGGHRTDPTPTEVVANVHCPG